MVRNRVRVRVGRTVTEDRIAVRFCYKWVSASEAGRHDWELTLTDKVLAIGGVRQKTLASRRVGVKELILPSDNRKDFEELPDYIRKGLTVHFVSYFGDVLELIFPRR